MDHTEKHTPGLADVAVVRPGQDTYDERRAGFQLARPHRPELIALPADARQVAAVAEYARRTGLPLAVQRTGHGRTAPTEGGVLLDTGRLRDVRVDPGTRTAWVAAGATWQDVLDAAAPHGLAPPSGSAPSVGAVGYTLAGGLGLLARQYGYAADLVRRMDVVTPPGEHVRATPEHRAELFWALRGGGGLGTVTGMEIELLPVARVWGGRLVYGERDLPGVLAAYPEWTDGLPEGFGSSLAIAVQPDLPAVPEELRGRYTVQLGVVWNGSAAAGERLLAPLREDAEPLADTSGELPYAQAHTVHRDPEEPHAYDGDSALLDGLDATELTAVADLAGPASPVPCILQLHHLQGALAREPEVPGAVAHREARFLLRVLSPLPAGEPETCGADVSADSATAAARRRHRLVLDEVAHRTLGRSPAFVFGPHSEDPQRPFHPPAVAERLARVRATEGAD